MGPGQATARGGGRGDDGADDLIGVAGVDLLMGGNGNDLIDARDGFGHDYVFGKELAALNNGFDRAMIDRTFAGNDTVYDVNVF